MKVKNLLVGFGLLTLWYVNTALNAGGAPSNSTGAPGEITCSTNGGCHNGGTQTGTATIDGLPTDVEPNKTYNFTITCNSTTATSKISGFQLTALDGTNAKAGEFVVGLNQKVASTGTPARQYLNHSKTTAFASGKVTYNCSWTAPATVSNKTVTFYTSVLMANGASGNVGDKAVTATKAVNFKTTSSNDAVLLKSMTLFPNPVVNELNITLSDAPNATFTLSNHLGQTLISSKINEKESFDVSNFARGTYFAKIQVGEKQAVKKVVLQ